LYKQIAEWRYDIDDFKNLIPEELKPSCNLYLVTKCNCIVSEFAPKIFQHIRIMDNITEDDIAR